jgi:hypothetical protein
MDGALAGESRFGGATMTELYCTGTIKRRRRTNDEIGQLERQIVTVLEQDHPQSVRHVFYRMTDPRLPEPVEKSESGYRHVQDRIVKLRRAGRIPYHWITDATRRGYFTPTYRTASDFLRSMAGHYRADLWQWADFYCEVWTESRSIAGVIQDDCEELAVSLYPAGGFASISLAYQAAEWINRDHDGRTVKIFYIGDYDPAGVLIDVSIERELRLHLDAGVDLQFKRLGITAEQIAEHDLPTKPRKEKDKRALYIEVTVEAEALPAHILRALLRQNIEALLPSGALTAAQAAEQSEREHIQRMARIMGGAS